MVTILELARELKTTKTTINRKIEALALKEQMVKTDGVYYLTDEQADNIRNEINRNATRHAPQRVAEPEPAQKGNRNGNGSQKLIEALERRIESQEKQLEKKDAQIEALEKEIARLHDLVDQQQKLTLFAEQRALMLEDKQRKSLFYRLFHKDKDTEPQEPAPQAEGSDGES